MPGLKHIKHSKRKWTPEQIAYAVWYGDPYRIGRKIDIANQLGVSLATIYHWERTPGFMDLVYEETVKRVDARWPELYRAAIEKGKRGDMKAFELLLKATGRYVDEQVIRHEFGERIVSFVVSAVCQVCGDCPKRNHLADRLEQVGLELEGEE